MLPSPPNFNVKGTVTSSKAGIKIAKLYMDNSLKQTASSNGEFDFYCENIAEGEHTIVALAYDSLNNQNATKIVVTVSSAATATSAIKEVEPTTVSNAPVYNLQGQRARTPIKNQMYVRKGKTFIY